MSNRMNQVSQQEDFSGWYHNAIREGELIAESPTKGTWTILPRAVGVWNNVRSYMTKGMEQRGIQEVIMPTLFPITLLEMEAEHVEGFAPEVYTVTHAGSKKLEVPYVVRPTSEVVVSELLRDTIASHRDLPIAYNQWTTAFRAEKRPRPFLRSTEFLWQEGYTAHSTDREADAYAREMSEFYADFYRKYLSLATVGGEKSVNERFPGAVATYSRETLQGGRAIQLSTSHNLGNHFALSHGITYTDTDNVEKSVFQTSWGAGARMIGAVVMEHGDDKGIVLPPQISPEQITLVPAWRNEDDKSLVDAYVQNMKADLGSRSTVAQRQPGERLGATYYAVERTGSPLQLVVGQREIDAGEVSYKLRHSGERGTINIDELGVATAALLNRVASEMLDSSTKKRDASIVEVEGTVTDLIDGVNAGKMVLAGWSGTKEDEQRLKADTGITIRNYPDGYEDRMDPLTGKSARAALFAKSY